MTSLDERLRRAFREVADEVPADSVPPLVLPPRRRRFGLTRGTPPTAQGRARAWAAVASSAVLVGAVTFAATALASALHRHQVSGDMALDQPTRASSPGTHSAARGGVMIPAPAPRAAVSSASPAVTFAPLAVAAAAVPRYYVALTSAQRAAPQRSGTVGQAVAEVRVTSTGSMIAKVTPPAPYNTFSMVTAASDDRTFVLAAQQLPKLTPQLFMLHVDPASPVPARRTRLVPLPRIQPGAQAWDLALSPNGTRLAAIAGSGAPGWLQVFNLATGGQRIWTGKAATGSGTGGAGSLDTGARSAGSYGSLSWAADERTLAFVWASGKRAEVRLLNTDAPGTSLIADSRRAITATGPARGLRQVLLTRDGQTILAVTATSSLKAATGNAIAQQLTRYSAMTGRVITNISELPVKGGYERVLWSSSSGKTLIVARSQPGTGAAILSGGTYAPIPWSATTVAAAW